MSADLEREIQRLLDAGESPSERLAEALESEPELRQAALEMEQLDGVLGEWAAAPMDLDEDVFVRRIAQRLDEQLAPLEHDPTMPPAFDDPDSRRRSEDEHSGEFELSALTERASEPQAVAASAAAFAQPPAMEPQPAGKVVQLEAKRSSAWVFAAAAVVGLVAAGGMFAMSGTSESASMAMVHDSEAPAAQAMPHDDYAPAPEPGSAARAEGTAEFDQSDSLAAAETESEEVVLAVRGAGSNMARRLRRGMFAEPAPTTTSEAVAAEAPQSRMAVTASVQPAADPAKTTLVRTTSARVFGCFESPPSSVRVRVWVDGRTGRVREVDVPSGGRPPEVECVRRAVRSARFPVRDGVARYTTTLEYER